MSLSRWLLACVLLSLGLMPVEGGAAPSKVLVLGRISDDPKSHYQQLQPLLDYVVPRMRDVGITEGRILMARDAQQMASYLRRGRVDWATETAGTAMALGQRSGARPLLLTERNGVRSYHSIFFVRKDSPIATLRDMRGHTLALQSVLSTSAYLVPAMELLEHGVRPEILLTPGDAPAHDSVGYVFARSELNISTYVHKGVVDSGVVSSLDWGNERSVPAAFKRDFRVIHRSGKVPRALEMVRGDLDPAVRQRLQEVLLQASHDPLAAPALKKFFGTSGFYRLDADSWRTLGRLKAGLARVRMEVE